ncbi:hypothetical protein GO730_26600 [Spirosoma sp. HMF3257]|uniref:DUF4325 domain-containing protein n=1 Tax=Spirosoma telluris TaxID=2183553 RepID=A0A327NQX1_9BACT|nr:hypothetical protein [Spirosoma telluris]RAI76839.1 hypothetical protein HMF3257_26530 [Spirosoma telluris]
MKTLNVADLIGTPNAILQKFGLQVYDEARSAVEKGEAITVDLSSLKNATSAFFHASFGNLYHFSRDKYAKLVNIKGLDSNPLWQDKYDDAITFAEHPEKAQNNDAAISKLFVA